MVTAWCPSICERPAVLVSSWYLCFMCVSRDECRWGLQHVSQLRQWQAPAVAHRADRQRRVPGPGVGERGEDHLQDPVEARRKAGLQPRRGCGAVQGTLLFFAIVIIIIITIMIVTIMKKK